MGSEPQHTMLDYQDLTPKLGLTAKIDPLTICPSFGTYNHATLFAKKSSLLQI